MLFPSDSFLLLHLVLLQQELMLLEDQEEKTERTYGVSNIRIHREEERKESRRTHCFRFSCNIDHLLRQRIQQTFLCMKQLPLSRLWWKKTSISCHETLIACSYICYVHTFLSWSHVSLFLSTLLLIPKELFGLLPLVLVSQFDPSSISFFFLFSLCFFISIILLQFP